ncbi:MAG: bifunctional glycosyltransferase family 2/GtrA family protein [Clostridia bacterium]|nr:bifunctional glycosyltransferase family 2/GtrA family protein [Clostridia bacterium]
MPDEKMIGLVRKLQAAGFETIVVNDGSPAAFDGVFAEAARYAEVLRHEENRGKGEALKTGLRFIRETFDAPYVVVNVDADGQHRLEDVFRVAECAEENRESLVIGSRVFKGRIPFRSRAGNAVTRLVFRLATGVRVYDTQTGLRAYGDRLTERLLRVGGSRYEYEMKMLMELAREKREIREVRIDAVYIDGNASSHFHPVRDSAKIYGEILKFSASSLISFGVDYALFCLFSALTGSVVFSNIAARILSGALNFTLNKKIVFRSGAKAAPALVRYISLAVLILLLNTLILEGLTAVGLAAYVAKIITETVLFVFSYLAQHGFVFRREGKTA